jgi:lysyl-tRNA synthetase class 2
LTAADWAPAASFANLKLRARILSEIRAFFYEREILEVETPALSIAAITEPHLESFQTLYTGPGMAGGVPFYLHTSPEFPMKRLLAYGSGPIYQIARVFRQGERGRLHNPEFTLLEWYRPGYNHHDLMQEVDALVRQLLGKRRALVETEYLSYAEAFVLYAGINPHLADLESLQQCASRHNIGNVAGLEQDRDAWLDLILTHKVEPHLGQGGLTFLYDYPASQASLARVRIETPPVAERFELYFEGVELANGFHELQDAAEQRRRFEAEQRKHTGGGQLPPLDERLLAALQHGMPDCSGVALGVDRLLMLLCGAARIDEVIAFPVDRA